MQEIKLFGLASYKGHTVSDNGSVNLSFKFAYDELATPLKLCQMLNNDINVMVQLPDVGKIKLGMFRLKMIRIDGDGESTVKFNSLSDFVETDNLNRIITKDLFKVKFSAVIEEEV
jgi:hypothetical protein